MPSNIRPQSGTQTIVALLPALNEAEAIGPQVRAMLTHPALCALPLARVLVVDNGSDDATAEVARAAGADVVREPRRGYGRACLTGVLTARDADILLLLDADGSDDLAGAAAGARPRPPPDRRGHRVWRQPRQAQQGETAHEHDLWRRAGDRRKVSHAGAGEDAAGRGHRLHRVGGALSCVSGGPGGALFGGASR